MTDTEEDDEKKLVCDWCSRKVRRTTAIIRGGEKDNVFSKDNVCSICVRAYHRGINTGRREGREYVQGTICDALGVARGK